MNSTKANYSSMELVLGNEDLIAEILLHVSARSALEFKLVSRKWWSIISRTTFASQHARCYDQNTSVSGLLLKLLMCYKLPSDYAYIPLDGKRFDFPYCSVSLGPVREGSLRFLQSCNGLFLCSEEPSKSKNYILNPTTKQLSLLPPPPNHEPQLDHLQLAFDPRKSPDFQVVCVQLVASHDVQFQVYFSKTKEWRLLVKNHSLCGLHVNINSGVYCDGAIYWVSSMGNGFRLLLDEERIETTPRPPLPSYYNTTYDARNFIYFGESGGNLYFIVLDDEGTRDRPQFEKTNPQVGANYVVYKMKSDCSEWNLKYRLNMNAFVSAYPNMVSEDGGNFRKLSSVDSSCLCTLSFVDGKYGDEEGPLMVIRLPDCQVVAYNFRNQTFKKAYTCGPYGAFIPYAALKYTETLCPV